MPTKIAAAADIQRPLTLPQYAALLNITIRTASKKCQAGLVPGATRISERGDWRIPLASVPPALRPAPLTETIRQRRRRGQRAIQKLMETQ